MAEQKTKLDALNELIKSDPQAVYEILKKGQKENVEEYGAEYRGKRDLRSTQVGKREGKKNADVSKLAFSFQKKIVKTATNFLFGEPVNLDSENDEYAEEVRAVWENNRIDTILQDFTRTLKSETEAVLMFYLKETPDAEVKKQVRVRLFDHSLGLYAPYYDEYGDLIAFMWEFVAVVEGQDVPHYWLWTDSNTYKFQKGDTGWSEYLPTEVNLIGKIPIVFMRQDEPEWWDVKDLIDRYELGFSKFADMNDYFAAPTLVVTGKIEKLPEKDKSGRAVKIPRQFDGEGNEKTGKLEYLTWQQAPESIKNEFQVLKEMIYALSDTPDISFDNLKGMTPASGEAMKMQFMGAELKAKESHGKFEEAILRMVSIMTGLGMTTKEIRDPKDETMEVRFNSVIPKAVAELVDMLSAAIGNEPVMSTKTAVEMNPLVDNAEEELKEMEGDVTKKSGDSFQ